MEYIRQAVERAKKSNASDNRSQQAGSASQRPSINPNPGMPGTVPPLRTEAMLNSARLEFKRVISHDITDHRTRSFDMLRTQVLQTMNANSWQLLGVVSPTEGCGKSVIATNLALSIARQPERSVMLVDMDLHRPQIASNLGLKCDQGLISVLEGKTPLSSAVISTRIKNSRLLVLPCETSIPNSSEWMASRSMTNLLYEIKRDLKGWTVIFDLPPILLSDDVISILPQIDCALFVVAAGSSTTSEIKECNKHLESIPIARVVLNKAAENTTTYYSYSRYSKPPKAQASKLPTAQAKKESKRSTVGFGQQNATLSKRLLDRFARF
jgi:protein-tyrosine kinase